MTVSQSNFGPHSLFGVPLVTCPQSLRWSNIREVLYDVFAVMHRGWVQDYLLCADPLEDLRVLTSTERLARALSCTVRMQADGMRIPALRAATIYVVELNVPVLTLNDVAVGLTVASSAPEHGGEQIMAVTDYMSHFATNVRTADTIYVAFKDKERLVQVMFYNMINGKRAQGMLYFHIDGFKDAFVRGTNTVDFDKLERALVSSVVGEIDTQYPLAAALLAGEPNNAVRGELYPRNQTRHIVIGDYYSRNVFARYANGAPLFCTPLFLLSSRTAGTCFGTVDQLTSWAVTERLSSIPPVLQAPIATSQTPPKALDNDESSDPFETRIGASSAGNLANVETVAQPKIQAVRIAPAPQASVLLRSDEGGSRKLTYAEEADARRREKMEKRKIQKRLAAARSNAKRRSQRKTGNAQPS